MACVHIFDVTLSLVLSHFAGDWTNMKGYFLSQFYILLYLKERMTVNRKK